MYIIRDLSIEKIYQPETREGSKPLTVNSCSKSLAGLLEDDGFVFLWFVGDKNDGLRWFGFFKFFILINQTELKLIGFNLIFIFNLKN